MRDKDLYTQILGIQSPWQVADVELTLTKGEVKVFVEQASAGRLYPPDLGKTHYCY